MLVKNISDSIINLKSGSILPGNSGQCSVVEFDLLMSNNRIEIANQLDTSSEPKKRGRGRPRAVDNG